MTDEGVIVGIDLGTTNSLVAVLQGERPVILRNADGELMTPSAVAVGEDGSLLVGAAAKARAALSPDDVALAFKRDMGTGRTYELGRRSFRPEELSAMVLRSLKEDAETALGVPVREAVVTVPAYFGDLQRQATRDAASIAGLHVERIVNEPTAAAMAYGLHNLDRDLRAIVLDLGGGTFDVTILEIVDGVLEIQSTAGDARLGGEDFTDALAQLIEARVEEVHGSRPRAPSSRARLRTAAELLKRRLSEDGSRRIAIPGLEVGHTSVDVEFELEEDVVAAAFAPLIARLRRPIMRALSDARVLPGAIEEVLLVGGGTRMPELRGLSAEIFSRLPRANLPTDEAVALGAAVQAALKEGHAAVEELIVTDVAPFTLGIATGQWVGSRLVEGLFTPILERGTVIPASRVERFHTMSDRQTKLFVEVYQGEHSSCDSNTHLGTYKLKGLPPKPAGQVAVDVRMTYDLNGILEVEMNVVGTKRREHLVIERNPGQLSRRDVEKACKEMERLKFHPRDSLPNRTALARAEALYVELTGEARVVLGTQLARFRGVLEAQHPDAVEGERDALNRLLEELARPGAY